MTAWLTWARQQIGTREVPGRKHNPKIIAWANKAGRALGIAVNDDETPWCGTFCAAAVLNAGLKPPSIAVRAKSWATWGQALAAPVPGAVLVFERPGGGHVGFYTGETATHYRVLGGNQSNAVNEMLLAKNRCIAVRWPAGVPVTGKRVHLAGAAAPVSENEA